MKLNGKFGMDLADQLGRRDGEPFREPAELLLRDLQQVLGLVRPLVPAVLESFVEQQESRLIPEQPLDAVLASAAKRKSAGWCGSRWKCDTTSAASPSMDLRMSVWPQDR